MARELLIPEIMKTPARCIILLAVTLFGSTTPASAQSVPVATADAYCALQGLAIRVAAPGLLANDVDPDGDPIEVSTVDVTPPANGTLAVHADGSFDYAPLPGFTGAEAFTYRARDPGGVSNLANVTIVVDAQRAVCQDESNYLSILQSLGLATLTESFEDATVWGITRTTAVASVASSGVLWRSNHPANGVRTSIGAARTGSYGLYSLPHGDTSAVGASPLRDGFRGDSDQTLYGVGAWLRSNTPIAEAALVLDDTIAVSFLAPEIPTAHRFFGVVELTGFASFEFYEREGTAEDQKFVFADDVILGSAPAVDDVPPRVMLVSSTEDTGDGRITPNEVTTARVTTVSVTFDEPLYDPPGDLEPDDATNLANYLLVEASSDGVLDTSSCSAGVDPSDLAVSLSTPSYTHPITTLDVAGGASLPAGSYRLLVCGSTSLRDLAGNPLDGDGDGVGGDDFVLDFAVVDPPPVDPTILLKVNGLHPDPPLVTVSGPIAVTATVDPGTVTESFDWYFAIVVGNRVYWLTPTGISPTVARLGSGPAVAANDFVLLRGSLSPGVTYTFYFLATDGTVFRAVDSIKAIAP